MADINNTYSNCQQLSPLNKSQHIDEETMTAVENITQGPLNMAIEKVMDEFCGLSVRLMQQAVISER